MTNRFNDKVVLISGAGQGIGAEIAISFAREGARLALFDKDNRKIKELKREIEKERGEVLAEAVDITKLTDTEKFLNAVKSKLGNIDVLINNVGVGLVKKFPQTSQADFDLVFDTNFKGAFFLTQKVVESMKEGANIIFITSIHAQNPSLDPTYDASKAAVNSLVANLALDLASRGIRVNAVAPGHIDIETPDKPKKQLDVPLTRKAGKPVDVAAACLFLADNSKSRYITGVILPVTGGLHIPIAKDLKF